MNLPNVIHLPSDEEAERSRRFTVHRHYLGSVELMLAALYGMGDDQPTGLLAVQRRLPAFTRIQRRAVANPAELRRLLAISWASEIQLRLADVGGDSFLRYSNAWGPVQPITLSTCRSTPTSRRWAWAAWWTITPAP